MADEGVVDGVVDDGGLRRKVTEGLGEYRWVRDVRRVLPELRASGRLAVDAVPWRRYHHAFGRAEDVPDSLRALSDCDPDVVSRELGALWDRIRHQGGTYAPAALAVPFLIRLAANPAAHCRANLLLLTAEAGHRDHFGGDMRQDLLQVDYPPEDLRFDTSGYPVQLTLEAAREAITADVSLLIPLLDDADAAVRSAAAYTLATASGAPPVVSQALRARLALEDDEPVRISLVLALAQLAIERSEAAVAVAWAEQLWTDEESSIDLRLAGALAWVCATVAPPPQCLLDLLAMATTSEMEQWMRQVPWQDDLAWAGSLAVWLAAFLNNTPAQDPENPFASL
ncbi:HEAT repeat domain-containing protein [Frankia sp. CNm7]|uniref:HEAT repeat domain-containing protein n=1 Tax=Frankia nepalensis TaxID=1836974 RepID=A0A937UK76_9ACTN|nr:hypothetical protein [Frankia nepalensis]MBL7502646.1 HEAT repeat domain-containing protein [Frankia nepalensis]MBL7514858.1 HEAT repeat domain-containing protein [Frankia nepalensis]MBL7520873.1 HEAT repeat domain-containing protein [Frankia nepalensis]MBL7626534.1 hypothetical protein [Frankia nepalensis]